MLAISCEMLDWKRGGEQGAILMSIERVGVIGAGTMGNGVAHIFARAGYPVTVMKLVEVIRGLATTQETLETVRDLALKLGKIPVEVNDAPGFVSNRVLMPLLNEAMYAVMEGVATPEAVDEVFKLGMAHPMGPLTLADFIGLDVCLDIMRVLLAGLGDPKYRPCPLLI